MKPAYIIAARLSSGSLNRKNGGPAGTSEKVEMVGSGSLGGATTASLRVQVPMHVTKASGTQGRVAWWVADEGTKAKINAGPDDFEKATLGKADPLFDSQSPPYPGHQMLPPLADFDWEDGQRAKALSKGTIPLATEVKEDALGSLVHDYTVHSAGVLADVRAGRLKRDLSNLLARPVTQLEEKPLYLADGRMNAFSIDQSGKLANGSGIPTWKSGTNNPSQWGVNLEELHLFHSIHRDLTWSGGSPKLTMKSKREQAVTDRYYIYKRPATQALQFLFSLQALPAGGKYKMVMKLDAMVAVRNPNDIPLVIPAGFDLDYQLSLVPYDLKWNIQKQSGAPITVTTTPPVLQLFKGTIEGRSPGASAGFTLEAGEAAVFGSSTARGYDLDVRRGFVPGGGVEITTWNLNAANLSPDDEVDFEFIRRAVKNQYGWMQFNAWIGGRAGSKGWQSDRITLNGGALSGTLVDESIPPSIRPPQIRKVSDFIAKAQPVLMLSFLQNVEQSANGITPDAFASRPFQLSESPISDRNFNPSTLEEDRHAGQGLITAESMNYQFRTLAAGAGGRSIYVGGGRQPNLGGTFNMIDRRIPLAPPLSIGAFQNAIASGFCGHFNDGGASAVGNDPFPANAVALTGRPFATPLVSRAIGNSHGVPQLAPDKVFSSGKIGSEISVSTDQSWMVNTALWDSWFLSGIVDGTGSASSNWMTDSRSARDQFMDLAEGKMSLRNKRLIYHPHKTPKEATEDLFTGKAPKDSAIHLIPKYLLIDGAFNVNSTSEKAWATLLASVRKQELITANGSTRAFGNPFGTLGYAANDETSGTQGDWSGLRDLSDGEINSLAEAIVTEVQERGPFLSMADFVNRRPDAGDPAHQALGALQAAINRSGLNDRQSSGGRAASAADFGDLAGAGLVTAEAAPSRSVGSRGYLSQGDLLTAIGPQIAVRSDSFVIRAYGDARDPSGKILAKTWCEAVIQRVPEFVDPADSPEAENGWPQASSKLTATNSKFGRRMEIRSFRWLSSDEL